MAKSELEKLIKEREKLASTRDALKYEKSRQNRDIKIAELDLRIEKLSPKQIAVDSSISVSTETMEFRYKDFLDTKVVKVNTNIFEYIKKFFAENISVAEFISETDSKHNCSCCVDYRSYPSQNSIYSTNVIYDYLFNLGVIDISITHTDLEQILTSISDINNSQSDIICIPMVNIRIPKKYTFLNKLRFFKMWCLRNVYESVGIIDKNYRNDYFVSSNMVFQSELKRLKLVNVSNAERINILRNAPFIKVDLKSRFKDMAEKDNMD